MAVVTDYEIRLLRPDEFRAAAEVFRASLHLPAPSDEEWERVAGTFQPERGYGAFEGDRVIGTTRGFDAELVVPGGGRVPMDGVTSVGVRADRTRQGVLTELMRAQLTDCAARGDVAAALRASEAVIYGRFGYGIASRTRSCTVSRARARFTEQAPAGGETELLDPLRDLDRIADAHRELTLHRAGMMSRPQRWWNGYQAHLHRDTGPFVTVVHRGAAGVDGFATYTVERPIGGGGASVMRVDDMQVGSVEAVAGLWRFLLSVDLVGEVRCRARPVDEPLELMLQDPRACTVDGVRDETWLRLLDVPAALAARTYGPGRPVVIEVVDRLLERNSGSYAISQDGAEPTTGSPALRMDVATLASLYLGDRRATELAETGGVEVLDVSALPEADLLFATLRSPWCGTFY